jgi:hypothetical protein
VTGGKTISFITYTKGATQYVTTSEWETQFLNWLNEHYDSSGYKRETHTTVGVVCCPREVHHVTTKKEAAVLSLVKKENP